MGRNKKVVKERIIYPFFYDSMFLNTQISLLRNNLRRAFDLKNLKVKSVFRKHKEQNSVPLEEERMEQ